MEGEKDSPQKRVTRGMQRRREKTETESAAETRPALERHLTYDELQILFRYLNGRDLSSAMRVCSLWSDVAATEKRKRLSPHQLLMHPSEGVGDTRLGDMRIQPVLGLRFTNATCKKDIGCHCANLPRACDIVTVTAYGPIWNDREIEEIDTSEPATSCLFLPAIPGVVINTFSFRRFIAESSAELTMSLSQEDVKCLAFFVDGKESERVAVTLMNEFMKGNEHVAIWGGIAKGLTVCKKSRNRRVCDVPVTLAGWSISGKDVSAWSVVIGDQCTTEEKVEETLTNFKAKVDLRKYSVGFMVSCCDRGSNIYSESNVESGIFRKLFPAVPLVGTFGGGEFGRTSVAGVVSPSNSLQHWTSTVFTILSYG